MSRVWVMVDLGVRPAIRACKPSDAKRRHSAAPQTDLRADSYHDCSAFGHVPDPETETCTASRISCESGASSTARAMIIAPTRVA